MSIYETFKKFAVPADSVEDFCNKYHRRGAYHDRGAEYMAFDLKDHIDEFERNGMTFIPHSSSTTGNIVAYYGAETAPNLPDFNSPEAFFCEMD
jgi:hypothetical protein